MIGNFHWSAVLLLIAEAVLSVSYLLMAFQLFDLIKVVPDQKYKRILFWYGWFATGCAMTSVAQGVHWLVPNALAMASVKTPNVLAMCIAMIANGCIGLGIGLYGLFHNERERKLHAAASNNRELEIAASEASTLGKMLDGISDELRTRLHRHTTA